MSVIPIFWKRLDRPGHEIARLRDTAQGHVLEGVAVFAEAAPCQVAYTIVCDADWRTTSLHLHGWRGERDVTLDVHADGARRWAVNGTATAELDGCEDIDLGFSPSTNLLPIRRLRLSVGQRALVRAAWVRFPELVVEPLEQVYERSAPATYRYESDGGRFTALLEVNGAGFVMLYPGLWKAVNGEQRAQRDRGRA